MKKVVIVGAGIAGLTAAIYACQSGFEVEVYEMNALPGGECTGWNRKGYHIDNCVQWLTGTKPGSELYELWQNVGAIEGIELYTAEKFLTYKIGEEEIYMYTNVEKLRSHLKEISPEDSVSIDEYCDYILALQAIDMPIEKPMEYLNVIDYIKLGKKMCAGGKIMHRLSKQPAEEYFSKFKHPVLREALTFGLTEGSAYIPFFPMATISSGNGAYPMGGSLAMAERMAKKATGLGAKIYYNQEVRRIIVENKTAIGIELMNGKCIKGDYIVPSNDLHVTMYKLLEGKYKDKKIDKFYTNQEVYQTRATVSIGIGVACDLSDRPQGYVATITPFKIINSRNF